MDWLKKHGDTLSILVTILVTVVGAVLWINAQVNGINNVMNVRFSAVDAKFSSMEKDIAIIKTVMIMNHHMPCELAHEAVNEGRK